VLAVVPSCDVLTGSQQATIEFARALSGTPVIQEGRDVAVALVSAARHFGVQLLILGGESPRFVKRSVAERVIRMGPPFAVMVMGGDD
jgi:hypothetical protein